MEGLSGLLGRRGRNGNGNVEADVMGLLPVWAEECLGNAWLLPLQECAFACERICECAETSDFVWTPGLDDVRSRLQRGCRLADPEGVVPDVAHANGRENGQVLPLREAATRERDHAGAVLGKPGVGSREAAAGPRRGRIDSASENDVAGAVSQETIGRAEGGEYGRWAGIKHHVGSHQVVEVGDAPRHDVGHESQERVGTGRLLAAAKRIRD